MYVPVIICNGTYSSVTQRLVRPPREFNPNRPPALFFEQDTLPLLISTGWFQERIRFQVNT